MQRKSLEISEAKNFIANHPFFFMIKNLKKMVLFQGRVEVFMYL